MHMNIYEIFDEFKEVPDKDYRLDLLQRYSSNTLREVLKGTFHPNIHFSIKQIPEYKPSDAPPGMGYTNIDQEMTRVYLFQENNPRVSPNLTLQRKEQLLIQILESLEAREAEVFANMILKDQKIEGLTAELVEEVFPGLLSS